MPDNKKQIPFITRSASFLPETYNEADGTIEVIAATETEVLQRSWDIGLFNEVLSMVPGHVRLDRLRVANLLDNHDKYSSVGECIIGAIQSASISNGQLRATVKFSVRENVKDIIADIKAGIIRSISIGYRVFAYEITEEVGKLPLYRAIDWEPFEISFVAVPADHNAMSRSAANVSTNEVIINFKNRNMDPEVTPPAPAPQPAPAPVPPTPAPAPAPAPAPGDGGESERSIQELRGVNTRNAHIIDACHAGGLSLEFTRGLLNDATVTQADATHKIIAEMMKGQSPSQRSANMITVTDDEQVKERSAIEYAILNRAMPGSFPLNIPNNQDSTLAANYRNISILGVVGAVLSQRGMKFNQFNKQEMYERSMSTSDFPNLMSNIANKVLRREYTETPQTFKALAIQQNLPDFKVASNIQFGGDAKFEEVKEGAEIKFGSFVESADNWKLSTYAKIFKLTRQLIINDDLNAFTRIARLIARGARNNESNLFWNLIINNTKLGDNVALFHATHANLAGSGAALSVASMDAARVAMQRQKGLTSDELIVVRPKFIVVAPEQEMAADQLLTNITPNQTGQTNPFASAGLQKIVEQRLPAGAWYVFADPAMIDLFTYGYLEGAEGLYTETQYGFHVDGVEIKARTDFGVKTWDYRGTYKNAGA